MSGTLNILVVLSLIGLSSCSNTNCGLWKNGSEWRCAKDNAPADNIHVSSTCNGCIVQFKVSKWRSQCHKKGTNFFTDTFAVSPETPNGKDFDFPAAGNGGCMEFFVFDCRVNDAPRNCPDVLQVSAKIDN